MKISKGIEKIKGWIIAGKYFSFSDFIIAALFFLLFLAFASAEWLRQLLFPFDFPRWVVLTAILALAFRKEALPWRLIQIALIMAIFAIPLGINWSQGTSNANIIAGFIPYKDGFYYYNGAQKLLLGHPIGADGLQGAFRPLMPALLSVLLWLSAHNLQATLALIVFLSAYATYLSAHALRQKTGPLPAALLLVLIYAFVRPMIGFTLTELPSLMFSCLSFFFLIRSLDHPNWLHFGLGATLLILALSIRAGAFFMLPCLVIWFYRLHPREGKRGWRPTALFAGWMLVLLLITNVLIPRILTENSTTFGNFSWMLYGQAVGGAGWMAHTEALGTSDPQIVLAAAVQKILNYPLGLIIATMKSYRDFFSPGYLGMFHLISENNHFLATLFWLICLLLTMAGLLRIIRNRKNHLTALLLAAFLGILLSIPFLPPVDGGNRFYAGSAPYFFSLSALGIHAILHRDAPARDAHPNRNQQRVQTPGWLQGLAILLILSATILPVGLYLIRKPASFQTPSCPDGQTPVNLEIPNGAYVDIIPESQRDPDALTHSVTLESFIKNNLDKNNDDFYQELIHLGQVLPEGFRIAAVVDRSSLKYYFAVIPLQYLRENPEQATIIGCAQEFKTQFQRYLLIDPSQR